MKTCDICGTLNFKENNFCTHCGNKFIINHFCPFCGEINLNDATHCIKCNKQINPIYIDDFDILFSDYNHELLLNAEITAEDYMNLLSNLFARASYVEFNGRSLKDKILNFASIFAECIPKSRGYERGSIFVGKYIFYDDRLEDSVQIATIIHELAHYFLFGIIESLLCDIFKVRSSPTLQSFVWYFLTLPEFKIMNEYCAHTVEGRFIPFGYQNYGSFNSLVDADNFDAESLNTMIVLGNSFANEIIIFLENYIDEDLREEIKIQYRKDSAIPNESSLLFETSDSYDLSMKNSYLIKLLFSVFAEAPNSEVRKELERIKEDIIS